MAAKNEDVSVLSLLISHPLIDIGAKNGGNLRAIHVAAMEKSVLAVRLLLTVSQGTHPQQYVQELRGLHNEETAQFLNMEIERLQALLGADPSDYISDIEVSSTQTVHTFPEQP